MATLDFILKKYNIKTDVIEIPNVTREDLAALFWELNFKKGAEVGVAGGNYSKTLCQFNPDAKIWGVDPYIGYRGYKDYTRTTTFEKLKKQAYDQLQDEPNYTLIHETSVDALDFFNDEELDFVYIDANHSEPWVSQDIENWSKKVKPGGIVAGDDYARIKAKNGENSDNWAVIPAIHKYAKKHDKQLLIWGLEAKLDGLKRDPIRSWSFVK